MTVTHKINMDLARRGVIPRIDAVQEDKYSRVLEFSLYAEGIEWTPPANAEIVVRYERPDGKVGNYTALITDEAAGMISGNMVSVTLAPLILAVAGIAKVAVGLVDGDVEITTFFAEIKIQKNPGATATASSAFGDASVSDVAAGKTFTSDSGQGTGTLQEIAAGKTFSNSGGNISHIEGSDAVSPFFITQKKVTAERIIRKDAYVTINVDASKMGDAAPEDVAAGKTFTSKNGLKMTGTRAFSETLVKKSGTTTSNVIDTGLSQIDFIVIYASSVSAPGLVQAQYDGESSYYIYCISYSSTIKNFSIGASAHGSTEGGVFTWGGTGNAALTEGVTYNWIAYGSE